MVINQSTAGAAVRTFITSGMTASVPGAGQTFTVNDDTGYPVSGAFTVVIDKGESTEEKVLVASRAGTTFTVSQRGYDGTVASAHTSGAATVQHPLAATIANALITHVDDGEADPHSTKLLNNARHDVEARHQFGASAALGLPVTPTALTPDIAGAAGTGNNPAREDHVHNVPAATAGTITGSNAEGTAGSFARSDHNHAIGADTIGSSQLAAGAIDDENLFSAALSPMIISATNPGAVGANRLWLNTASGKKALLVRNAADTAWEVVTAFDWIPYTPTYPGMFAVGNAVHFARYTRFGKTVVANGYFRIGSTTSFAGLTNLAVSLPVAAADLDSFVNYPTVPTAEFFGHGAARGTLAGGVYAAVGVVPNAGGSKATDRLNFFATAGSAAWSQTVPGSWAAGDRFSYFMEYEAASAEDTNFV